MGGVASTIAALGNGIGDGDLGVIRVTQGGETFEVFLVWDETNAKWVSDSIGSAIDMHDQDWSSNQQQGSGLSWQYFGGTNTNQSMWNLRATAIPFAGALLAAGLNLQDRGAARMYGGGSSADVIYVSPWFYEFDGGDVLVLDNDTSGVSGKTWDGLAADSYGFQPSTGNLGHGGILKFDGTKTDPTLITTLQYEDNITTSGYHGLTRGAGWDYVKFFTATTPSGSALGGVPTATPYTPVKKYLYPTLYGYGCTGSNHGTASLYWEFRWTS